MCEAQEQSEISERMAWRIMLVIFFLCIVIDVSAIMVCVAARSYPQLRDFYLECIKGREIEPILRSFLIWMLSVILLLLFCIFWKWEIIEWGLKS